jgi:hypothetical protein
MLRPTPRARRLHGTESPVRVSFEPGSGAKQTFGIRGQVGDLVNDAEEDEEGSK